MFCHSTCLAPSHASYFLSVVPRSSGSGGLESERPPQHPTRPRIRAPAPLAHVAAGGGDACALISLPVGGHKSLHLLSPRAKTAERMETIEADDSPGTVTLKRQVNEKRAAEKAARKALLKVELSAPNEASSCASAQHDHEAIAGDLEGTELQFTPAPGGSVRRGSVTEKPPVPVPATAPASAAPAVSSAGGTTETTYVPTNKKAKVDVRKYHPKPAELPGMLTNSFAAVDDADDKAEVVEVSALKFHPDSNDVTAAVDAEQSVELGDLCKAAQNTAQAMTAQSSYGTVEKFCAEWITVHRTIKHTKLVQSSSLISRLHDVCVAPRRVTCALQTASTFRSRQLRCWWICQKTGASAVGPTSVTPATHCMESRTASHTCRSLRSQ